jgi:hypothetical protein
VTVLVQPGRRLVLSLSLVAIASAGIGCAGRTASAALPSAQPKPQPLVLNMSTHVASAPAYIVVRTRIAPDPLNRGLTIEWWSEDGEAGSHAMTLDGERAVPLHSTVIPALSSGNYEMTAILTRADGTRITRNSRLTVVGGPGSLEAPELNSLAGR